MHFYSTRTILLLFYILVLHTVSAQQVEVYQVLKNEDFHEMRENRFDRKSINDHYAISPLEKTRTDAEKAFLDDTNARSFLFIYFLNSDGEELSAEEAVLVTLSLPELNYELDFKVYDELDHHVIVAPLDQIELKVKNDFVKLEVNYGENQSEFWFGFQSFPYDSKLEVWDDRFAPNDGKLVEAWTHDLMRESWKPMYLGAIPHYYFEQSDDAGIPLRPEEGADGFLITGNFSMPFLIVKGRDRQNRFFRMSGIYTNSEFSWRIAKNADSSPLVPLNTKVGFGAYRSFILSKAHQYAKDDSLKSIDLSKEPLKTLVADVQVMHYSNGQDATVEYSVGGRSRTDYKSGNFSTNYLRVGGVYNQLNKNLQHLSASLYYRYDFPFPGFAEYEVDQIKSYGYHRLDGFLMFKSRLHRALWPFRSSNHRTNDFGKVPIPGMVQHQLRFDYELIMDDVSMYNEVGGEPDRRFSMSVRYENRRTSHRSVSYFIQYFIGRDDLNIRYNLWTRYALVGMSFRFPHQVDKTTFQKARLEQIKKQYEEYPCKNWLFPCWKANKASN